jgi:CxxC motif-containing protein (DUF1111 family)
VHALFTIVGRSDIGAPAGTAAVLPYTDFETQYRNGNLSFRIPLQTLELGLIEAIQDLTILNTSASTAALRAPLGIGGIANRSGNDGTITRFGWKAQNKSLAIFAGEAYHVEMGVTNDVFPSARDETPACNQGVNEPTTSPAPTSTTSVTRRSSIPCTSSQTGWSLPSSCAGWPCPNRFHSRVARRAASRSSARM